MDEAQHFRLAGTATVVEISCDHVDGQNVIFWEVIKKVFPGVEHVECDGFVVNLLRDSNHRRIEPECIKYCPGVVLDVVSSSSDENASASVRRNKGPASVSSGEDVVESLQIAQEPYSSDERTYMLSRATIIPSVSALSDLKEEYMESEIEQQLVPSHPSDFQVQVGTSASAQRSHIQAKGVQVQQSHEELVLDRRVPNFKTTENNGLAPGIADPAYRNNWLISQNNQSASKNKVSFTGVKEIQNVYESRRDETWQQQIGTPDRLALLQKNVKALLTQTYELYEYSIPRLFIILPQDASSWNSLDLLSNKFRLYFLCECGEHTKSTKTKIPHHIHLAKHEGYELVRPVEFFQQYGPYVLTILQMLKHGLTVAGVAVPALTQLILADDVEKTKGGLKSLTSTLELGVNQAIECIEKVTAEQGQAVAELSHQMGSNGALEGADLRQLESFLNTKDEHRVLGNLYRTVTGEGHVKWVCIDHYRENYHEKASNAFRDAVAALDGLFDENIGRVEVKLHSKVTAEQFYAALEKSRSIYELRIELDWETSQNDFKKLRDTLALTKVGVLELYLRQQDGLTRDILNRNRRYDSVLDIMRHPSIQSFAIRGPRNLSKRSSLLSRNDDLSNLRHLEISLHQLQDDISSATYLISKATNLSSLIVRTLTQGHDNHYALKAYNTIAEHWTCPINFKDWNRTIPPPPPQPRGLDQSTTAQQCMEHLLQVHYENTYPLSLYVGELDESTVNNIAKATTNGSAFKGLYLRQNGQLGDPFISNVADIVARSELDELSVHMKRDGGRVRILDSIQWKHLRKLEIILKPKTFETSVMKALVDGLKKTSERVELELVRFQCETDAPWTLPQWELLQTFVASTSIEELTLKVAMTLEQMLLLLESADVSRLTYLNLWTKGFDEAKVDALLNGLGHAKKLKYLLIRKNIISYGQMVRMEARGVSFDYYKY
ncbi:hypothetical protein BGX34_003459 [Mortierella sp. NVP85]|nr:hypothetical protein BGX34_003459 [Mortierella sp. NVP85]